MGPLHEEEAMRAIETASHEDQPIDDAHFAFRVHVGDIMSTRLLTVHPDDSVESVRQQQIERGVHHIIVVHRDGELMGMLCACDLEEAWPERPLLPKDAKARGRVRQLAREAGEYLNEATNGVTRLAFGRPKDDTPERMTAAREALAAELPRWEGHLAGEWLAGELSLADLTAYPSMRILRRVGERMPQFSVDDLIGPRTAAWMGRIEALPYYARTFPPHWKA